MSSYYSNFFKLSVYSKIDDSRYLKIDLSDETKLDGAKLMVNKVMNDN